MTCSSIPVNPILLSIQIQLVHAESDRNIFRLPQLFIGILVAHAQLFHDASAAGIPDIVCGRDVGHAVFLQPGDNSPGRLRGKASVPELLKQSVAEVMAVVRACVDIPCRKVAVFRADGVMIPVRPFVHFLVLFFEQGRRFFQGG